MRGSESEGDQLVGCQVLLGEASDEITGVSERGRQVDLRDVGDDAIPAAGGDLVGDVAGEGGAVTGGEGEDVSAGDDVGARGLDGRLSGVDHLEAAEAQIGERILLGGVPRGGVEEHRGVAALGMRSAVKL
ncbi:unnamed protein product [Spirodela intermedia]|uniref:Uncharacterized protein n=1 Tax=Spirodela intermedia TaxID=51605 RepID=A0A7I8JX03_SPIIN|nr:unnamed protein product [Spirodela intermedia]